jgi:hypothetical protein
VDEVLAPQVEIDGLDIPHDDPAPIGVVPAQAVPRPAASAPLAPPVAPDLCRSMRVRIQATQGYTPIMKGSKYSYAVTQMEIQGVLSTDVHMFVQEDFYQSEPDIVAVIITKLSLKAGLKEWGDQSFMVVHS